MTEAEGADWMPRAGIPMAPGRVAADEGEAVAAAEAVGYPIVLKTVSPDIAHKSDVGGVALDFRDAGAVAAAWRGINDNVRQARPEAAIEGVLVAPMLRGVVEMVAGVQADPVFGPVVMLGMGGVLVEVLKDVAIRVTPFGVATVLAYIPYSRLLTCRTVIGSMALGFDAYWLPTLAVVWLPNYLNRGAGYSPAATIWIVAVPRICAFSQVPKRRGFSSRAARGLLTSGCVLVSGAPTFLLPLTSGGLPTILCVMVAFSVG